jgi:hypothetical protein
MALLQGNVSIDSPWLDSLAVGKFPPIDPIAVCNDIDPSPYWVFNIAALETFTFSVHLRRSPSGESVNCTDYRCRHRHNIQPKGTVI